MLATSCADCTGVRRETRRSSREVNRTNDAHTVAKGPRAQRASKQSIGKHNRLTETMDPSVARSNRTHGARRPQRQDRQSEVNILRVSVPKLRGPRARTRFETRRNTTYDKRCRCTGAPCPRSRQRPDWSAPTRRTRSSFSAERDGLETG